MDYRLIRSSRRTLALEMRPEGLVVRAPYRTTLLEIELFLRRHRRWIEKHSRPPGEMPGEVLGPEELRRLAEEARRVIPQRVARFAPLVGVDYGRITIRCQRTRWGSCSSLGNLNFNCLLMLCPPEVLDTVVVHELCHRKQLNHSKAFYAELQRVCPDWRESQKWLKENGAALMRRVSK